MSDEQKKQIKGTRRTKKASTTNCVSAGTGDSVGECNVCCSKYTSVKRKQIKCLYCDYDVCNECLQQYLLSKADSHCMNCKKVWGKEFLKKHFSKAFVFDRLQEHYVDVLMQLETSLFPETMEYMQTRQAEERARQLEPIAQFILTQTELIKRIINFYETGKYLTANSITLFANFRTTNRDNLRPSSNQTLSEDTYKSLTSYYGLSMLFDTTEFNKDISIKECVQFREQVYLFFYNIFDRYVFKLTLEDMFKIFNAVLHRLEAFTHVVLSSTQTIAINDKKKLTRCTTEKCSGYFMHDDGDVKNIGECKICKNISCVECLTKLESKHSKHVCDPGLVATVKLLKESTVPCPNCKTSVSKIQGCDQMFCTSCNTAFDWKTGEKVSGRIHNPHYFEYLQKNKNKAPQQVQQLNECEQRLLPDHLITKIYEWTNLASYKYQKAKEDGIINTFWYIVADFHGEEMPHIARRDRNNVITRYRNYRVDFMSGVITKDTWRRSLKIARQNDSFNQELYQLYEAVVLIAHNIYTNLADQIDEIKKIVGDDKHLDYLNDDTCSKIKLRDCKINGAIDNAVEAILDLIKYYNEHRRIINTDYGSTNYQKIVKYDRGVHTKLTKISENELDIDIANLRIIDIEDDILTSAELELKKMIQKLQNARNEVDAFITSNSTQKFHLNYYLTEDDNSVKTMLETYKQAFDNDTSEKFKTKFDEIIINSKKKGSIERKEVIKKASYELEQIFHVITEEIEAIKYAANLLYTVNNDILKDTAKINQWYKHFEKNHHAFNKHRFNTLMNHYTGDKKFLGMSFKATEVNLVGFSKEFIVKAYILSITSIKLPISQNTNIE
jgi:hypothetical protein